MTKPAYEATNSDVEKLISSIKVDIDKRKSMPPRGDSSSNIERLRVINDTMKSFSTESVEELISALEDANALNKHLDLAIRKAEGCSEALRRRAEAAENRIAELEAAPNGMMQLSNELAEMKRKCADLEKEKASLRPVGVISVKAMVNMECGNKRFIALWPRPGIYIPRKRPEDGVIVYARTAGGTVEGSE